MKPTVARIIGGFLHLAMLMMACSVFLAGAAYAQGGPCAVSQIRVRIGTAAQNPLVNSLDLEIHFTNGTYQTASNVNGTASDVNGTAPWGINSQMVVKIPLNRTVPVTEIKRIRLIDHISAGAWDMSFLRARAIGSGGLSMVIAEWGTNPNPSPHRFTPTYPAFGVYTKIPVGCGMARMPVQGPVRVAPGIPVESSRLLTNERIVQMVRQGQPETRIISAIEAGPVKFDLSHSELLALHREGVSEHVLNAMVIAELRQRKGLSGAGGAGGANATNGTLLAPGAQQAMLGTQANSTPGDGGKSALLPAVQRRAITDGTMGDGSVRTGTSGLPGVQRQAITDGSLTGGIRPAGAPQVGTSQIMSATGNVGNTRAVAPPTMTAPAPPSMRAAPLAPVKAGGVSIASAVAAACAKDPTFRVIEVTGSSNGAGVVFEPDGGQYTIWGCSFGPWYGNVGRVVLFKKLSPAPDLEVPLTTVNWTDTSIVVTVPGVEPSSIQGHMFVTLFVHRGSDGKEAYLQGQGVLVPTTQ